ncbi:hypothetical protein BF7_00155 [Pseudomonas phage Bf7]|uniref:Uncharacterized protein n=1 Tax=Pseudomonas phage Bf7 TaxID=1100790 RepID=H2ELW7_9CAUD|nr:hypothetical protein BF7_00155 [Pseudomonas phage Bf7]AEX65869.1 hypothetical protein BF7_00155 [Pseudomonas phage Bf7]
MIQKALQRFARFILGTELAVLKNTIRQQEQVIESTTQELAASLSRPPDVKYMVSRQVFNKHVKDKLEQPLLVSTSSSEYAAYCLGIQRACSVMEKELVND